MCETPLDIDVGMDFIGEVVCEFLGLNESKYQYVVDAHNRHIEDLEREAKVVAEEDKLRDALEAKMVSQLEGGLAQVNAKEALEMKPIPATTSGVPVASAPNEV